MLDWITSDKILLACEVFCITGENRGQNILGLKLTKPLL
jgi:hypothetical protein